MTQTQVVAPKYLVCYAMANNKKTYSVHFVRLCNTHESAIIASRTASAKLTNKVAVMRIQKITKDYSIVKTMDDIVKEITETDGIEVKKFKKN